MKEYKELLQLIKDIDEFSSNYLVEELESMIQLVVTKAYDKGFSDGFNYDLELKVKEWEKGEKEND